MWSRKSAGGGDRIAVLIGEGCHVEGRCQFRGRAMIDGQLTGDVVRGETLIVGDHGTIVARVEADTLVVHGRVMGDVVATTSVELHAGGQIAGDVAAPVFVIHADAVFEGRCRIVGVDAAEGDLRAAVIGRRHHPVEESADLSSPLTPLRRVFPFARVSGD